MKYSLNSSSGMLRLMRFSLLALVFVVGIVSILGTSPVREDPRQRPGASFNGSAKWALQIAQPVISACAADAQIYQILGAVIWRDGRLPENTGTWSFVSWSPTTREICQVTVDHGGGTRTSTRDSDTAPSTASGGVIPAAWVNSTAVFSAIPGAEITRDSAQLVVFNVASYDEAPNTAVWGINFAGGKNPLVRWDGYYIGTQFD